MSILDEARILAMQGYGREDIVAKLGEKRITTNEAWRVIQWWHASKGMNGHGRGAFGQGSDRSRHANHNVGLGSPGASEAGLLGRDRHADGEASLGTRLQGVRKGG